MLKKLSFLLAAAALLSVTPANAATLCFQALSGAAGINVITKGGNSYTTDSTGLVCGVSPSDAGSFENSGFVTLGSPQAPVSFHTLPPENPTLMMYNGTVTPGATFNSVTTNTVLSSVSGRSLSVGSGLSIMVSGTAGGATALALECSDGTLIASWPVADLVDQVPMGIAPYVSTKSQVTLGAGLTKGCASGTAVYLSNVGGALTTTTLVYLSLPHTIQ